MEIKVVENVIYIESDLRRYTIVLGKDEELLINSEYSIIGIKPYAENKIGVKCTPDPILSEQQKAKKVEG